MKPGAQTLFRELVAHPKSALWAEISGSIFRYDALAARPEVLLYWHFVCACADSLKLKSSPYSWRKCLQGVNKYNVGRKKITKVAFRALAIPQSTPTNGRGVFAYRYFSDIILLTPLLLQSCALDWMGQQSIRGIWFLKELFRQCWTRLS